MITPIFLAFLSGFLYVFSFAPWDQGYLQWVAFAPLFYAVHLLEQEADRVGQAVSKLKLFSLGFILSFMIGAGGFYWVTYAVKQYGGLPDYAAVLLFFAFCLVGQLQVPLFILFRSALRKNKFFTARAWAWPLASGLIYVGIESFYPKIFMDTAGAAFYKMQWTRQAADIGGPFFLTALILLVNEFLSDALIQKEMQKKLRSAAIAALTVMATLGYGAFRYHQVKSATDVALQGPKLQVAMVQANIGDYLKVAAERGGANASRTVMDAYLSLSDKATQNKVSPDAILWPETAYPSLFNKPQSTHDREAETLIRLFAHNTGKEMIFGGYDQDERGNEYNSLFFYHPQTEKSAEQIEVYRKSVLLMFGETLPFADTFPSMKEWFPNMGFFGRGPGPQVFEVKNAKGEGFALAPSICYEGLFAGHSLNGEFLGADALLNVTNDSWFGPNGEPYLHLELTIFRSIETRTPMLRSTNTGITTYIDPTGEMLAQTEIMKPDVLPVEVPKRAALTSPLMVIATYLGADWFVRLGQLLAAIFFIQICLRKRHTAV